MQARAQSILLSLAITSCPGEGNDTSDATTTTATDPTTGVPTSDPTAMTTDPTDGEIGAVTVCATPVPLRVSDWTDNMTFAIDPAGTALYLTVHDVAYRWTIAGGADCGFTADTAYTPTLGGEATDIAVTADGEVYASIEFSSFSPARIWPQADAGPCLLGPDEGLGAQSIAVGVDGTGIVAGSNDGEYHTQLYRTVPNAPTCTLELQWTETGTGDDGYEPFVLDADGRAHVLALDPETQVGHVIFVFDAGGAMVTSYKPDGVDLCTGSALTRCGADICVMSCTDLYRFASDGTEKGHADLAELFNDYTPTYVGAAGADDGSFYVLRVAGDVQPDGHPLEVLRFGG